MKWCGPKKKLGFPFDGWAVVSSPLRGTGKERRVRGRDWTNRRWILVRRGEVCVVRAKPRTGAC
jgi:hypothetical protein